VTVSALTSDDSSWATLAVVPCVTPVFPFRNPAASRKKAREGRGPHG